MFRTFAEAVRRRWTTMSDGELFVAHVPEIFEKYLSFFPAGTDPLVKTRTQHDCQTCKQFIRRLGCVVAIEGNSTVSVWDNLDLPHPYDAVAQQMSGLVRSAPIKTVFRTKERRYGCDHNFGADRTRYDHFSGDVANRHYSTDCDTRRSEKEATFQVLKRGLEEIRIDDLNTVLDLISENGLYRGAESNEAIKEFKKLKIDFNTNGRRDLFVWANLDNKHARFRNTAIARAKLDKAVERKKLLDALAAKKDQLLTTATVEELEKKLEALEDAAQ